MPYLEPSTLTSFILSTLTSLSINHKQLLMASLIYGYKHKYLEGSLTTGSFTKLTIYLGSCLGHMIFPAKGS